MNESIKFAFSDTKKNSLDLLNSEVHAAEYTVAELETVVQALQQKSSEFSEFLNDAELSKETALSNLNLFKSTLNNVKELQRNAKILYTQTESANSEVGETAEQVSELIRQLIFSGEMVNGFAQLVFKKKQMNPLISEELVKTATTAMADVNEAVASTLTALQSCYSSKGVAEESASLSQLQLAQATGLLESMTGGKSQRFPITPKKPEIYDTGELNSLIEAVEVAKMSVKEALDGDTAESKTYTSIDDQVKVILELAEESKGLRKKLTNIEAKLHTEKKGKYDEKKIKALETSLKSAKAKYDACHQKLLDAVSELILSFESKGGEKCSVKSAQKHLIDCQSLFNKIETTMARREKTANDLRVKICNASDEFERIKLEIMLQYEEAMIEVDELLLECKEQTLKVLNNWLANANAHFLAADVVLTNANNKLSNALNQKQNSPAMKTNASLQASLEKAYQQALDNYHDALKSNGVATQQLDDAQAKLDTAAHKLASLKAGFSAATAAALAA